MTKQTKAKAKVAIPPKVPPTIVAKPAKAGPKAKPAKAPAERADGLRSGSKVALVMDMLCRKRGASRPEIAEAIGWQSMRRSTLKRMAAGKLKLREDKDGRFFGTPRA